MAPAPPPVSGRRGVGRVYLDYNASTPLAPAVAERMRGLLGSAYGNPSSEHWAGREARALLDGARRQVADLLGCAAQEIVFTSGGSEANNLALKGVYYAAGGKPHIITSRVEHPAIVAPCRFLQRLGAELTWLPVDAGGCVDPDELRRAMRPTTRLISIMHANNETGSIQPIRACAAIAREAGVPMHTDAAQSLGKIAVRVADLGVDLLSLAGHKLYAPKGVGALYVREGLGLEPLIHGAGHEAARRAGTESVLLCAALAEACRLAADLAPMQAVRALRDRLWGELQSRFGARVRLNGHPEARLPNTLNVSFVGRSGAEVLAAMPEVAASTGSACHDARVEPSAVLQAMGVERGLALGAVRFSLGRETTAADIQTVVTRLAEVL